MAAEVHHLRGEDGTLLTCNIYPSVIVSFVVGTNAVRFVFWDNTNRC